MMVPAHPVQESTVFLYFPPKFSFLIPFPPAPDLKDMSQMVLRTRGPRTIFTGHRLVLHVDFGDADKVGVFYGGSECPMLGFGGGTDSPNYWGSSKTWRKRSAFKQSGYHFCNTQPPGAPGDFALWDPRCPFRKV